MATRDINLTPALFICPACGHDHTHVDSVTVFVRAEEDGPTRTIAVHFDDGDVVRGGDEPNPSARRDAVRVAGWCEGCDHRFTLDIVQHKGQTFLHERAEPAAAAGNGSGAR